MNTFDKNELENIFSNYEKTGDFIDIFNNIKNKF